MAAVNHLSLSPSLCLNGALATPFSSSALSLNLTRMGVMPSTGSGVTSTWTRGPMLPVNICLEGGGQGGGGGGGIGCRT